MPKTLLAGLTIVSLCVVAQRAEAQFTYRAPEDTIGYAPGSAITHVTHFQIWQSDGGSPIDSEGFSMSCTFDVDWLSVEDVEYGPEFDAWTPDFFATAALANGWTCGVVYWFLGVPPSGLDWPDFTEPGDAITITYSVDADAPFLATGDDATANLIWASIGSPSVANVVVAGGDNLAADLVDGSLTFTRQVDYIRGDMNTDGQLDIADVFTAEDYLFLGGETPSCLAALDVNSDLTIDIADIIRLLSYLFLGDAPPAEPFASCGHDPTDGPRIDCLEYQVCP
ncbi:MAG: dockerin type I repeat-containing protein [Planctomycetes bacterium]|nr:dockerin type I repeat-containing protein [Planctomycetota bacterium]